MGGVAGIASAMMKIPFRPGWVGLSRVSRMWTRLRLKSFFYHKRNKRAQKSTKEIQKKGKTIARGEAYLLFSFVGACMQVHLFLL